MLLLYKASRGFRTPETKQPADPNISLKAWPKISQISQAHPNLRKLRQGDWMENDDDAVRRHLIGMLRRRLLVCDLAS